MGTSPYRLFLHLFLIVSGVSLERGMTFLHLDLLTNNSQSRKSASCVLTQDIVSLFFAFPWRRLQHAASGMGGTGPPNPQPRLIFSLAHLAYPRPDRPHPPLCESATTSPVNFFANSFSTSQRLPAPKTSHLPPGHRIETLLRRRILLPVRILDPAVRSTAIILAPPAGLPGPPAASVRKITVAYCVQGQPPASPAQTS